MKKTSLIAAACIAMCAMPMPAQGGNVIPADHPAIYYMGRTLTTPHHTKAFNFPGVTAMLGFSGTSFDMHTSPGSGYYVVEIDNNQPFKAYVAPGDSIVTLASGLAEGNHTARITYAIEGFEFKPEFRSFVLDDNGSILPTDRQPRLKLEFIGNSITCGYGTEAPDAGCPFSYDTENHTLSYAHLTGRMLDADVNVVARSGVGVYRNYDGPREGSPEGTMPLEYINTMLYDSGHPWDFESFRPDIIFINLGTNDLSTGNYDIELFEKAYAAFLDKVCALNPQSHIVLLTGPMLNGTELQQAKDALDHIAGGRENVYRFDLSPQTGEQGYGADSHPSARQSMVSAMELIAFLATLPPVVEAMGSL